MYQRGTMEPTKDIGVQLPGWLLDDNKNRNKEYSRNVDDETFLRAMNAHLVEDMPDFSGEINHPIIFFFGVPRCGKTFFSQLINHYFDLGYPDNLIARFWQAPFYGIKLSQILKSKFNSSSDFTSDFGKTKNLFDPHDFAYFWHEHLLKESHPYDFQSAKQHINWKKLKNSLAVFSQSFGKACLFKGVNPSYHIAEFCNKIPNVFFVYLQRDLIDCSVSLARARVQNYGDIDHWFGQSPDPHEYERINKLPWTEQIVSQLNWLTDFYESQLTHVDPVKYCRVNYKDFCENPTSFFDHLQELIYNDSGLQLERKHDIEPDMLKFSQHNTETEYYSDFVKSFDKMELEPKLTT